LPKDPRNCFHIITMLCIGRHDLAASSMNELPTNHFDKRGAPKDRFAFGENWRSFLAQLDDARIAAAERSLQDLLGWARLDDLRFLDIGSGSGLSSLVARRLGASVYSFDYDSQSVECTKALRARFFPDDPNWQAEQGSILDRDYLARLGRFDIVYSWGVLHHTGAMLEAIANAARLVAPGGIFVFALYRKTRLCWLWSLEKRWYCRASPRAQAVACRVYVALMRLAFVLAGRDFGDHVSNYRSCRGMDYVHDIRDWLGGYPYESIGPAQVAQAMSRLGFAHLLSKVQPYSTGLFGSGCDEYVYARY
jgi:2-polyprenyl-3-methyl-5-hydroxy-6-metoxy-1,4-benzoquinol methylase